MVTELGKLARRCIPIPIKRAIWKYVSSISREQQIRQSKSIPYHELNRQHIQHTRILLNREDFLSHLPKGGTVAEIGVDQGEFSERILAICKPARLHLIDIWDSERYDSSKEELVRAKFEPQIRKGAVQVNKGYSTQVLSGFENGYFDWIYIDTAHTYLTTSAELELAREKVKPGGIIAGHDYVTGNWDRQIRYGVIEAVHEFCVKHRWGILYLTSETHQHRSFALRSISD